MIFSPILCWNFTGVPLLDRVYKLPCLVHHMASFTPPLDVHSQMTGGEVIQILRFADTVVTKVIAVIEIDRNLKGALKRGLKDIELEMKMVIRDIDSNEKKNQGATHEFKIALLKELACDIEDFLDLTWVPGKSGQLILSALGMDPRPQILKSIDHFKDRIKRVQDWKPDAGPSNNGGGDGGSTWSSCLSAPSARPYSQEATFKNHCKHTYELERLLSAAQEQELKVISIVGCRGVGKTTLARAVYDDHCRASCEYDCVAWVVASDCRDPEHLVTKVLKEAYTPAKPTCRAAEGSISDNEQTSLGNFLRDKRYFVVIDDVDRPEVWKAIKHEFPIEGHSSRIIVTTSVHSVAAECSWGSYVYPMQCLDRDESEQVFRETVGEENRSSPAVQLASEGIIKKCGGLPLALVSVADYLRRRGRAECRVAGAGGLTTDRCKSAARALGDKILRGQDAEFSKINRALTQCYDGLPDYAHRSCLLYASVFPRGRPINSKVLLRRWTTEELLAVAHYRDGSSAVTDTDEDGAKGCLEGLIDRCIIEPVEIRDARPTRCKVHSIMLEFIIHKAVSENFVALVDKDELLSYNNNDGRRVRRLSVQDSSKEGVDTAAAARGIDWSVMRSLSIFGSPLLDLHSCKLLRVLDLEDCKGFINDDAAVVKAICKQRFLKYLSLRGTDVVRLPQQIQRLEQLETLDIRDTGVKVVPVEVVRLPLLAHLLGRFELAHGIKKEVAKQSRLQTLAGVVVTEADKSFENIILHAGKLRKVKVYEATSNTLRSTTRTRSCSSSSSPLLRLKERFTGSKALQIVSIDSSGFSTEFISFLEAPCAITSIKLRGQLESLPDAPTLRELDGLNKLLLISTGLNIEDLSALQCLSGLEYLKLQEDGHGFRGGSFVVKSGGFPSLRRLCFEAPKLPQVRFEEGSMKSLTILDLLCPGPYVPEPRFATMYFYRFYQVCDPKETSSSCRLGVAGVSYLENLNKVILHHSTEESKVQAWKAEAIRHKNKPSVTRQPQPTIQAA